MSSAATKTLSQLFLIHHNCYGINNKARYNNLNCQSVKSVLNSIQWLSSALSGVSPNKSFKRDAEKAPRHLTQTLEAMRNTDKIYTIGFTAPVISIVIISFIIGIEFLIIGIVPYVIMLPVTLLLLFGLNKLFTKIKLHIITRLLIVIFIGLSGGASAYLLLFYRQISQGYYLDYLMVQYSLIGLLVSIVSFTLYSFGPLKVSAK